MNKPFQKTPPKSSERIRTALESVRREAGEQVDAGPHKDGLAAEATLVIASLRDHECARRYQELLLREGIMSQAKVHRMYVEVLVDYSDHLRAGDLLDAHLVAFPDRVRETWRRDYDFTIFGTVLGG